MDKAVIVSACRTAGGAFGGTLKNTEVSDLGAAVLKEAVIRSGLKPEEIEETIMGNGWQAGAGPNTARMAVWKTEILRHSPAFTVNKRCGSGLLSVMLAADKIRLGDCKAVAAGGMESASQVPYVLPEARWGHTLGEKKLPDILHKDGLNCPLAGMFMGETGELLADEFGISREEQDTFALGSHRKAVEAIKKGWFKDEIVPLKIVGRKEEIIFDRDEIPREDTTLEKLAKLPAIFRKGGTITAGSSSALCDGASALVVAEESWARERGYKPIAEILGYANAALDPLRMGLGPTLAVTKALKKAGMTLKDIDLIELNEAFAVQVLAVHKVMPFPMEICNVHGGAIALGHPSGATGAKILTTLCHALRIHDKEIGLTTACIGGGQGVAMVIRRLA